MNVIHKIFRHSRYNFIGLTLTDNLHGLSRKSHNSWMYCFSPDCDFWGYQRCGGTATGRWAALSKLTPFRCCLKTNSTPYPHLPATFMHLNIHTLLPSGLLSSLASVSTRKTYHVLKKSPNERSNLQWDRDGKGVRVCNVRKRTFCSSEKQLWMSS